MKTVVAEEQVGPRKVQVQVNLVKLKGDLYPLKMLHQLLRGVARHACAINLEIIDRKNPTTLICNSLVSGSLV